MMTPRLLLQRQKKKGNVRTRFTTEKLMDPIFQSMIEGKFASLFVLDNQDTEIDTLINSFKIIIRLYNHTKETVI